MTYEKFLSWCIDTSREDRSKFVRELPICLNSLLHECRPVRRRTQSRVRSPKGPPKGALKLAMESARKSLDGSVPACMI